MDSHEARALLRSRNGNTNEIARDWILADIHEWMETCMGLWRSSQQADRGEGVPMADAIEKDTLTRGR